MAELEIIIVNQMQKKTENFGLSMMFAICIIIDRYNARTDYSNVHRIQNITKNRNLPYSYWDVCGPVQLILPNQPIDDFV